MNGIVSLQICNKQLCYHGFYDDGELCSIKAYKGDHAPSILQVSHSKPVGQVIPSRGHKLGSMSCNEEFNDGLFID